MRKKNCLVRQARFLCHSSKILVISDKILCDCKSAFQVDTLILSPLLIFAMKNWLAGETSQDNFLLQYSRSQFHFVIWH